MRDSRFAHVGPGLGPRARSPSAGRAGTWRRTPSHIARGDDDEYLCVTVLTQGRGVLEQTGRKAELVPGSLVFYDTSEPFALRFDEPWEQVVIHVPVEQALASAAKRSADLVAVPLDGGGAAGAAAAFLRSLAFAQRDDPDGADLLAPSVPGLLASSLNVLAARQGAIRRAAAVPSDVIRMERVLSFLRAHLADPGLDADEIARGCYLSKRTLYRLFEGTKGSVMGLAAPAADREGAAAAAPLPGSPGQRHRTGVRVPLRYPVSPGVPGPDRDDPGGLPGCPQRRRPVGVTTRTARRRSRTRTRD